MSALDYSLLIIVLGLTLYMAFFFGKRHKNTNDYFLAGRRIPWLVACLSLMATEISILTVMAVAASSFREDWSALQYFIGSAAARVCVAYFFIPVFYQTPGTTIYEYLRRRFGEKTRYAAAGFFFLFRFPASAVRLTAAAAAMRGMSASESMQMAPRTTRIVRAAVSRERAWCEFMGKAKEHICRRDRIMLLL